MGRRCVGGDLYRAGMVLGIGPLFGVVVMLSHVAHSTALVVPVASMGSRDAAAFVGFPWGRATVHVPIELIGNGLGRNAGGSTPLLDLKPSFFHSNGLTILEQTTGHDLVLEDGTLVPASAEATESSDLENPSVALEGIDHSPAFGHEARHGLFAENVHPGFCAGN